MAALGIVLPTVYAGDLIYRYPAGWATVCRDGWDIDREGVCKGRDGIVLLPGAFRDEATAVNMIVHEQYHWEHGPRWWERDPWDEAGARRAACAVAYVPECSGRE